MEPKNNTESGKKEKMDTKTGMHLTVSIDESISKLQQLMVAELNDFSQQQSGVILTKLAMEAFVNHIVRAIGSYKEYLQKKVA